MAKNAMSTDPEFGFGDKKGMLPSALLLPTKDKSKPQQGASWQFFQLNQDGYNAEMQVGQSSIGRGVPQFCMRSQLDAVGEALKAAYKLAKSHKTGLLVGDLVKINKAKVKEAPPQSWESGCNPTLDAEELSLKPVLSDYKETILKHGVPLGGHVHFIDAPVKRTGKIDTDVQNAAEFVRFASKVATLPMMILGWSEERHKRLKMLGFGNFRMPSHGGIEMKDFSGFSLKSVGLMALQYGFCRVAFSLWRDNRDMVKKVDSVVSWGDVKSSIMSGDLDKMVSVFNAVRGVLGECDLNPNFGNDTNPYFIRVTTKPFKKELKTRMNDNLYWASPPLGRCEIGFSSAEYGGVPLWDLLYKNQHLLYGEKMEDGWGRFNDNTYRCTQDKGIKNFLSAFDAGQEMQYTQYNCLTTAKEVVECVKALE